LEWDLLVSAHQALKNHNIPLTSLTSRADDILYQEQAHQEGSSKPREEIIRTVMRYLDTDTLLCWAPSKSIHDDHYQPPLQPGGQPGVSLREIQRQTAQPILGFVKTKVWPGAELHPVLDDSGSILPKKQPEMTKNIIRGWISGLPAYELAALERGVLATKSLLIATRLLVEWSEEFRHLQNTPGSDSTEEQKFGIEEAAEACSTEVRWQTGMWGEVEDTHDVDKEDLRRQLGSVVMLVSGNK
jgi:ATP synthase mitochondrial F1 complex assembly factor 2